MIKLNSLLEIVNNYDNYIIDQWGVMHDGTNGYNHAIQTINYLKEQNKNLFIISNSSKRKSSSKDSLKKLGFVKESFIDILTSGEMIWNLINKKYSNTKIKKNCFHIFDKTKEDGLLFREGLNLNFVDNVEHSDLILACTPFSNMKLIDYIPILKKAIDKKLIMYCANPDFETVDKNYTHNIFCMGAVAEIYRKMGGETVIQGKPEKDIYIETTKSIKLVKSKTVAVGDSLFHDIKGANNFLVDSILIKSGIHKDLKNINMICKNHLISPSYIIDKFSI